MELTDDGTREAQLYIDDRGPATQNPIPKYLSSPGAGDVEG
jgi:hypothetical protein